MSKRTRLVKRWQIKQGDFELKRAKFNDKEWRNYSITFEVLYKGELIGKCGGGFFASELYGCGKTTIHSIKNLDSNFPIGEIKFKKTKRQLPSDIISIDIFPNELGLVFEKYVLFEKKGNHKRVFVSPGVFAQENH